MVGLSADQHREGEDPLRRGALLPTASDQKGKAGVPEEALHGQQHRGRGHLVWRQLLQLCPGGRRRRIREEEEEGVGGGREEKEKMVNESFIVSANSASNKLNSSHTRTHPFWRFLIA